MLKTKNILINKNNIPKNIKKSTSFLSAFLVSSAIVTPAYGMFSELFNPDDPHIYSGGIGSIGPKILTRLDDRSLGKVEQVSKGWQRLVNQTYDARYNYICNGKSYLFAGILEAVQAEPNEAARAWRTLKELLESPLFQSQASLAIKKKLETFQDRLLQPEDLLWKDALPAFLSCLKPDRTHPALAPLVKIIGELQELAQDIQFKDLRQETLRVFLVLKAHYEQYMKKLLYPNADRAALTHPKVILSGEGLMDLRPGTGTSPHGIHSYRISQEMALSLLSKDKYGLSLKKNASGSHAVSRQGRVYFKGNTTSTGLSVGMESASYWLMQVLFGKGMAPTSLLTLNEVEIKTPQQGTQARSDYGKAQAESKTSADFFARYPQHQGAFTEQNPHHVVQASLSVEGVSLEDFMKGVERREYNYKDLDLNSFSELIFMSLLTNPSDGTPGNFMVRTDLGKPYSIVGIDNDMAFGPPIILTKVGKNTFKPSLEVKNVLLCLPLMKEPLSRETRARILQSSPELILLRWLERLKIQQYLYNALKENGYTKDNKNVPYLKDNVYTQELHLPLSLRRGMINTLLKDFVTLQDKIRSRHAITHDQLFSFLQPLAHRFYGALKTQYPTPFSAYQYIHNSHHEGIFLENILRPYGREVLSSGKTVLQALADICTTESDKRQTIDEAVQEIWKNLDLNTKNRGMPFLELAAQSFGVCFQNKINIHPSWLQNSLLFRAIAEGTQNNVLAFLLKDLNLNAGLRDPKTQQNALHYAIRQKSSQNILTLLLHSLALKEQETLLNGADHQGITPLDAAMEQDEIHSFLALRTLGASNCSASMALKFYKRKVRSDSTLHAAFQDLMALNSETEWVVTLEELLPPIVSEKNYTGTTLTSSAYGDRQLPDDIKRQIFNAQGEFILISNTGNHSVAYAQKKGPLKTNGLYFKAYPALPGLEEACGGLTRQLLGFGAPHTDLVKVNGVPILISQAIPGDTLLKTLRTDPKKLANLDEEDISGMLIAAMLTNPEDGKPDNYVVTPHPLSPNTYRIVGIDNDQAFVPAIVKETPDKTFFGKIIPIAQVKTILYCLDQMKNPVHLHVRTTIINIHPDRFLENWLRWLKRINKQHCGLFTSSEQNQAFKQHKCFIGVPFQTGAIKHIYEKFVQLRDLLSNDPTISHIDLLAKLEPRLAKRYQAALVKNISVEERFREVDRPFYEIKTDSKKGESHTTMTQSGDILRSMGIPLKEAIFDSIRLGKESCPVQALEELEAIKAEKNEETLKSLVARVGDINLLKTLTLDTSRVLFLKELDKKNKILLPQEQTAIIDYLAQQKGIVELPLPNFSAMDDILLQKLSFEHLRKVDLRKCTQTTNKILVHLSKTALALEELNLGFLTQLQEIGDIGTFTDTPLVFKTLRILNLTNCINLTKLLLQAPKLHYLNLKNCLLLTDHMFNEAIKGSENLDKLVFEGCPLIDKKSLIVLGPPYKNNYWLKFDGIEPVHEILSSTGSELILKNINTTCEGLKVFKKSLQINTNLSFLTTLNLDHNDIGADGAKALSQGNLINLTTLSLWQCMIGHRGINFLSTGNLINLTNLNLWNNNIGDEGMDSLSTGNLINLTNLNLAENSIAPRGAKSLSIGNFTNLTNLNLRGNGIMIAGVKDLINGSLSALRILNLAKNNIEDNIEDKEMESFHTENLINLTTLNLWNNKIRDKMTRILSNFTNLTNLNLRENEIGNEGATELLDIKNFINLKYLDLEKNSIVEELQEELKKKYSN